MTAEELTLRPGKVRWTLMLLGSAVLAAGSIWIILSGVGGWGVAGTILFGLGILVSLSRLFGSSNYLRLSPQGFTVAQSLVQPRTWQWNQVGEFSVDASYYRGIKTNEWVAFDVRQDIVPGHRTMSSMLVAIGGRLPDTYGMKAKDLAALMNSWRSRYAQ